MRQSATLASDSGVVPKNDRGGSVKTEYRGRPRSEESEEAILAATIELLSEKTLRDISMEEIARKAGVGKATIYKWWPSKAYVALDAFLKKANQMMPTPDTGSARRDILEQLRATMVFYRSPAGRVLGQFVAESQIDKGFASLFRERFLKPRREASRVVFNRGVQRGEIEQNLNWELVLDMMFGSVVYRLIIGHNPLEDKLPDEMVSILFGGLDKDSSNGAAVAGKTARKHSASRGKAKRLHTKEDR